MERYVGGGTKMYSPFAARTEVAPEYQPERGASSFELLTARVPETRTWTCSAAPSKWLLDHYLAPEGVLFVIHPEAQRASGTEWLDELRAYPRGTPISVTPTASTRTVFVRKNAAGTPAHFLKLHLPLRISRFNRRLRRKNIENSVAITRDMATVSLERFAYLPDALGVTCGESENAWGFIVREASPRPGRMSRFLIPCFALYGADLNSPGDPPLLVDMIERLRANPESFILDEIMLPVVQCWIVVARELGVLLESHAQNTLLEVDETFRPRRIVHRDFDVWVDLDVRQRRGLEVPFLGAGIGTGAGRDVKQHYSVIYDRFIGHEFFDYMLKAVSKFYPIDVKAVRRRVIEAFHTGFPESDRFFPSRTMYYFSNAPPPGRSFAFADMHQEPVWR